MSDDELTGVIDRSGSDGPERVASIQIGHFFLTDDTGRRNPDFDEVVSQRVNVIKVIAEADEVFWVAGGPIGQAGIGQLAEGDVNVGGRCVPAEANAGACMLGVIELIGFGFEGERIDGKRGAGGDEGG